jgi:type II secretion system protein D
MNLNYPRITRYAALLTLGVATVLQQDARAGGGGMTSIGGLGISTGGGGTRRTSGSSQYAAPGQIGQAVISMNEETRSIIVTADAKTREYIRQVIESLDQPKPQVLIKVVFMEVTHNKSSDIGVDMGWGGPVPGLGEDVTAAATHSFGVSGIGSLVATNSSAALNRFGQPVSSFAAPGAGLYSMFARDYEVTIRAIAQAGNAKVLSRPSIVARNNQPAVITVGQSVPLITSVRFDNYGNAINSVTYQSVGIILQVTPFITSDGMVEMIVHPEISDLVADRSQWVPISSGSAGNAAAPLINSRTADTVVLVPDSQTVIIGGLMQDTKAESESKIPFLGDIPLIGNIFKHRNKANSKTELLIFLTPHIIQAPSEMASVTTYEKGKSEAAKTLTDQESNRYLDVVPKRQKAPTGPIVLPAPGEAAPHSSN